MPSGLPQDPDEASGPFHRANGQTTAYQDSPDLTNALLLDANLTRAWLTRAWLTRAWLTDADLTDADLTNANLPYANLPYANLPYANLSRANLTDANLRNANLYGANLYGANLADADLTKADLGEAILHGTNLADALNVDQIENHLLFYYANTTFPLDFDHVAHGWRLAPYCDFTPDAACGLADINQMFQAGNLLTGVTTSGDTDRLDLVDNDTIDAADITEWLAQAATANGHGSPYRRGDTEFDRDVDITDFNALASHFDPTGDGDPVNGPFWNEGNFNGDDNVDITDFNLLASNFAPSGYATSAIPEPSSVLLLLLGLGCVMLLSCSRS